MEGGPRDAVEPKAPLGNGPGYTARYAGAAGEGVESGGGAGEVRANWGRGGGRGGGDEVGGWRGGAVVASVVIAMRGRR